MATGASADQVKALYQGVDYEEMPLDGMRATIARRLVEAKQTIPHFYLTADVTMDALLKVREEANAGASAYKLSVNDFVLKASAEALRHVPQVNASWAGDSIRYHGAAHVSFAVAIEDGLITPVVRDTHAKSIFQISSEAKALGKRAKEKKLKPDEFTGGTFCVSNLGMMGIPSFSAIINPPNAAILAVGAIVEKPVVRDGALAVGRTMTLTLSCDHRVVDGAVNGTATIVGAGAATLRRLQTGSVRAYAGSMFIGVVLILGYYLWR